MVAFRALHRRVLKLEKATTPRASPLTIWFGSIDAFVDLHVIPEIEAGKLDSNDMVDVIAAIRRWEAEGIYDSWKH